MDPTQSVIMLNRVTFNSTVAQTHVDHWIVFYCVDWYELCQGVWEEYKTMAIHWERQLAHNASSWQATAVRFAEVDCATDKALCNANNIQEYPSVQHFRNGRRVSDWDLARGATSLSKDISRWIRQELNKNETNGTKHKRKAIAVRVGFMDAEHMPSFASSGLRELSELMSFRKDPVTAAFTYIVLATIIGVMAWCLGTGLELDLKCQMLGLVKTAKSRAQPSALFPQLSELPEPRTIVRSSFVL
jgi:hypothetical protein